MLQSGIVSLVELSLFELDCKRENIAVDVGGQWLWIGSIDDFSRHLGCCLLKLVVEYGSFQVGSVAPVCR